MLIFSDLSDLIVRALSSALTIKNFSPEPTAEMKILLPDQVRHEYAVTNNHIIRFVRIIINNITLQTMKTENLVLSIAASLLFFVNCTDAPSGYSQYEKDISKKLSEMSLEEKAGQLVQLNIDKICDQNTLELMPEAMEEIFCRYKIGSILNTMGENCPDREWMRNVMAQIQEYSIRGCGIPCIYGLDMIHGKLSC
jgi:hypothetical protein